MLDALSNHVKRFHLRSWEDKRRALRWHFKSSWHHLFPGVPLPVRLSHGNWWLTSCDAIDYILFSSGNWETNEHRFVSWFLRPGMNFIDVGAHHGFYTLLASKKVGKAGRVIAFEPSAKERKHLLRHLRLNRCKNVSVEPCALGDQQGEAPFFMVRGLNSGIQGLRRPSEPAENVSIESVRITSLDQFVEDQHVKQIDFLKMDAEGGELAVLRGARKLLESDERPVILSEVQDRNTKKWGHAAQEVIMFLHRLGYVWFLPESDGKLLKISAEKKHYDGNFVSVPQEKLWMISGNTRNE
jgi:FkbM family methyltransferase